MSFPQYSNIELNVQKTIDSRKGNQLAVSNLLPWIRISSAYRTRDYNGLIITSNQSGDSFSSRYGNSQTAGTIGRDFNGKSVTEEKSVRGFRPSPIIDALEVKNGSEGLTRKCSFTIKCFSLGQVELLMQYFLEPRFFALIEWGWNTNQGYQQQAKLKSGTGLDPVCEMISYQNLSTLKKKRKESEGHYDAFLGVIAGGGFSYGEDETFNLNVEVVTQGEIPSYLQLHKAPALDGSAIANSEPFSPTNVEDAVESEAFGKSFFMQMYNDLPSHKQIPPIKSLVNSEYWTDSINFLNMDAELRKDITQEIKKGKVILSQESINTGTQAGTFVSSKKGEIVSDQAVFSNDRYIRMELAWKILNTISWPLDSRPVDGCSNEKTINNVINIDNTICRAHPHIFSTDKSKLYIPNKKLPDFGLSKVLVPPTEEELKQLEGGGGDAPGLSETEKASTIYSGLNAGLTEIDGMPKTNREVKPEEYFPAQVELDEPDGKWYDDTNYPRQAKKEFWGYLKYLYINFDFFKQCLERNGFVAKDVALDVLNGISSAVNMYWDFQISERGNIVPATGYNSGDNREATTGALELQVVDFNFAGIPPKAGVPVSIFQSRGMNSPFIEFNFDVTLGGALANQVMAKRNQQMLDGARASEDKSENFRGLFAQSADPISKKINEFVIDKTEDTNEPTEYKSEKDSFNEKAEANWTIAKNIGIGTAGIGETALIASAWNKAQSWFATDDADEYKKFMQDYFFSRAGIFSKVINRENVVDIVQEWWDRGTNNQILSDIIFVGTYADINLLTQLEKFDENGGIGGLNVKVAEENLNNNPGFLPIKVNFTIHGVGGLKVGDIFVVSDLPTPYAGKMFQIMQVEHTLSDSIWVTKVEASIRNVDLLKRKKDGRIEVDERGDFASLQN
jgi:hypothetical protein